ncbi:amine oxidase catalytic domain-containing protein [Naematelia encephala]|uniref:Amine oxidase n=1 Tax=Naematelia encephala TaxID=71784 RepID=A0A1Y2AWX4_9TREE|nr:amine oxidase catalytic domain-containing protein [Naematelia encephala]
MSSGLDYEPLLHDDAKTALSDIASGRIEGVARPRTITKVVNSKTVFALLAGLLLYPAVSCIFGAISAVREPYVASDSVLSTSTEAVPLCETTDLLSVTAPRKNIWKNLSLKEATEIRSWLWETERGLNLTKSALATESDNAIFLIEAFTPRKSDALAYLDGGAAIPAKYAHSIINHGSSEEIIDYLIGPLPLSEKTTMRPLTEIYHRPDIPYNAHGFNPNGTAMGLLLAKTFGPLADVTMDLFGGVARGLANDTIIGGGNAPLSYDGTWRRMWMGLKLNVPGHYLFPLDIYTYFDVSGTDPALWHVIRMVYNNQTFASPEDFRAAWEKGELKRSKKPLLDDASGWASRSRVHKGSKRDLDERAGPRSVSFDGLRFRVDQEEQYITWMGFSFYLGFERDMGLNLWDIHFRGERIIYEITPQEAMAQYSGTDPHQATTVFLDRAFGMGQSVKELMVGYDCPSEAVYLPATIHTAAGSSTRLNAICVFEKDSTKPLSRHTGWLKDEMGAIKGYELTVRSISTVGNYDYLFDYTFQLDGTIEIRLSASGYLQGGVWNDKQADYGHQIRDTTMGSLHDHVINYKVDFDIAGTRNSLTAAMLEMEEISQPWVDEDWGRVSPIYRRRMIEVKADLRPISQTFSQQKIVRKKILTEDDSRLEYPKNMEGNYVISNEDAHNAWGNPRGYAIHPGASNIHLTNLNCKRTQDNVNWAKHHLSVTRRHDNEPSSSSLWNIHLPGKPTVDFYKFFDGESLDQEDLVVWLNLGTHHIPRAEDSPQTLTNVATSSVLLTPFNFNDYDVSMESMNAILLNAPKPGQVWDVDENGVKVPFCVPKKLKEFTYTGLLSFDEDGSPASPADVLEQRKIGEHVRSGSNQADLECDCSRVLARPPC